MDGCMLKILNYGKCDSFNNINLIKIKWYSISWGRLFF